MPENEFEKQVQQKMDEFRLRPSVPVWEKIKDDLNERKRRRFFFMISLLAAASLFGWMSYHYFFTNNINKIKGNKTETAIKENTTIQSAKGNEATNSLKNNNDEPEQEVSEKESPDLINKADAEKNKDVSNVNPVNKIKTETAPANAKNEKHLLKENGIVKQKTSAFIVAQKIEKVSKWKSSNPVAEKNDNQLRISKNTSRNNKQGEEINILDASEEEITLAIHSKKDETLVPLSDMPAINFLASISPNTAPTVAIPAITANQPLKFSRKIKWGLTAAGGVASRAKEPFDFFTSASAEKALFDAAPPFQQGNITGGVLVLPPSDVKPGLAFKAGIILEKQLSKKFTISSGLQYAYSSDRIAVGKSISASANNALYADRYYSAALSQYATTNPGNATSGMTNYTNQYHFIELPLQLQYNINKKWKSPLIWDAGVSISRLVKSDALLYDVAYGGVYYDAKNSIKKTQFNVFTGFALHFTVNRLQWSIGPQVSINTSRLFDNSYDNNRHPVFGGLNMRLILPGKKK